jgi:hypothetical protein
MFLWASASFATVNPPVIELAQVVWPPLSLIVLAAVACYLQRAPVGDYRPGCGIARGVITCPRVTLLRGARGALWARACSVHTHVNGSLTRAARA